MSQRTRLLATARNYKGKPFHSFLDNWVETNNLFILQKTLTVNADCLIPVKDWPRHHPKYRAKLHSGFIKKCDLTKAPFLGREHLPSPLSRLLMTAYGEQERGNQAGLCSFFLSHPFIPLCGII